MGILQYLLLLILEICFRFWIYSFLECCYHRVCVKINMNVTDCSKFSSINWKFICCIFIAWMFLSRNWVYQDAMPSFFLLELYEDLLWYACQGRHCKQTPMSYFKMWRYNSSWFAKAIAWWWRVWKMGIFNATKKSWVNGWCCILPTMWNTLYRGWRPACSMHKMLL